MCPKTIDKNTVRPIRSGFTLIELLIVIAILLAIGGLVVVNLIPRGEQAKSDLQRVQLDQITSAFQQFRLDLGRWPSAADALHRGNPRQVVWDRRAGIEAKMQVREWQGFPLRECRRLIPP